MAKTTTGDMTVDAFASGSSRKYDSRRRPYSEESGNRKMNPKGRDGKITRCNGCGSIFHYIVNCPEKRTNAHNHQTQSKFKKPEETAFIENEEASETSETIDMVTFGLSTGLELVAETGTCGILDSACSKSVCGHVWLDNFLAKMTESDRKNVRYRESNTNVLFGDMKTQQAVFEVTLPVCIAGRRGTLTADVIEGSLPLLVGRSAMKRAGCRLDMITDEAVLLGDRIKLQCTKSGHYLLPLSERTIGTSFVTYSPLGKTPEQRLNHYGVTQTVWSLECKCDQQVAEKCCN